MAIRILVLEGDGIGPEITAATLAVLRAADAKFGLGLAFDTATIGWSSHKAAGTTFPDAIEPIAAPSDEPAPEPPTQTELFEGPM